MVNVLSLALGVVVLIGVVADFLWTTLWVEGGAGPLTSRLMVGTWRAMRRFGAHRSRFRLLAGPSILVLTLSTWVVSLWVGWTLLFASADGAIVDAFASRPVTWVDLLYFTGYTVFTLGIGDFVPQGSVWQLATVLASATGMLFVTLSVSYLLSVLGAVTQKRAFASSVSGLGGSGADIVRTSWTGDGFRGLDVSLNALATQLNTLTANHKAYPVLHYFHSQGAAQAPASAIPVLDEALTLLRFGVPERNRPSEVLLTANRSSVQTYLGALDGAFIEPAARSPPAPDIEALRDAGVPTVSDQQFAASLAELDDRRRILLGLVESDVREWPSAED